MSGVESIDDDLRDVFAMMYEGDDWEFGSDVEEEEAASVEREKGTLATSETDAHAGTSPVESAKEDGTVNLGLSTQERYTKKRFQDQLDSLIMPSAKRLRVFQPRTQSPSIVPSTLPIPSLPSASSYAPFSPLAHLSRLRTFDAFSYSSFIPSPLTPGEVARYGWISDEGTDTLHCGLCGAKWDLSDISDIMDETVRLEVARRMEGMRVRAHRKGCAWRVIHGEPGSSGKIRRMLHPPILSSLGALAVSLARQCGGLDDLRWTSPLAPSQVDGLTAAFATASGPGITSSAAALALFAWYPYHPNNFDATYLSPDPSTVLSQTEILRCRICERRIGLWSFAHASGKSAGQTFDLLDEHMSWCPIRGLDHAAPVVTQTVESHAWWSRLPFLRDRTMESELDTSAGDAEVLQARFSVSEKLKRRTWRRGRA